jgi:APA family basic amino acid/polyamine antiporter
MIRCPDDKMPPLTRVDLKRDLGLLDAVGIGVGGMVGAGIFVVIGIAAGVAGAGFLIGLLIAATAATANALSSAQLAAAYPQAGGAYEYGYRLLRPSIGFAAGWMFLASKISAAGTVALGLAGYLEALEPGMPSRLLAVAAILVFTVISYFGVKRSSRVNLAIVIVSLGSLALFVVAGSSTVDADNLRPFAPAGWRGVLESAALLFFAYTGYARIATLAEEVRDPHATIPRAIAWTIGAVVFVYAGVAFVAVGSVGAATLAASPAPLDVAARGFPYPVVADIVSVGGIAAMLGVAFSQLLGLSRMVFAMARRGDLPPFLAFVHPRYGVPGRAVLIVGVTAATVAATGTLRAVAAAASCTILVYYGIANVAALRMPPDQKRYPDAVPLFGLLACGVLMVSLASSTLLLGAAVLIAGFTLRWLLRMLRRGAASARSA